jgi:adenylylsulfate kinase-like enzyme
MPTDNGNPNASGFAFSTEGRVYGFDDLFRDRRLVWSEEHPFIMIIWGPEGSGKSTLALELACLGRVVQAPGRTASVT